MSDKVLVTGGCGFIGKSLTSKLLKHGYEVVVVDKDVSEVDETIKKAQIVEGDVTDREMWRHLPKCRYVFHLAAPSSILLFNDDLDQCASTTITGLLNAFEWSRSVGTAKLIYPSSGSIFGKSNKKCSELTRPDPINTYGKTKLACEYLAKIYEHSMPSIGLRIFAGYGHQEDRKSKIASVVTLFMKDILQGKSPIIFGDGTQTRDFVYIDDIVDAMILVMTNSSVGVLNIGSGESTSFNEIVSKINNITGMKVIPTYIHKPSHYLEKTSCDTTEFKKILGRKITTIDIGIKKYLENVGHT